MKKIYRLLATALIAASSLLFTACPTEEPEQKEPPINVTVVIDASQRLENQTTGSDSQYKKDLDLIHHINEAFCKYVMNIKNGGVMQRSDRLQYVILPMNSQDGFNDAANGLMVDLGALPRNKEKRAFVQNMVDDWDQKAATIYANALKNGQVQKWQFGSDIWGFFSNDIKNPSYYNDTCRNIVIVITDGYLESDRKKQFEDGSYNWIGINDQKPAKLNSKLKAMRNDLDDIEVLFIELTSHEIRTSQVQQTIQQWLNDMNVQKSKLYKTDLTNNTIKNIDAFIGW